MKKSAKIAIAMGIGAAIAGGVTVFKHFFGKDEEPVEDIEYVETEEVESDEEEN